MVTEEFRNAVETALAAAPEATGRELDYSQQYWGHACSSSSADGGVTITGHLIGRQSPKRGDWLILPNGAKTTRYRITKARWCIDPDDMWEFSATFDPRRA